ncbi:hypothetical protein [Helicobacter enhydrae]|nr:hypothetical protein [Helicobacter enhydrae]
MMFCKMSFVAMLETFGFCFLGLACGSYVLLVILESLGFIFEVAFAKPPFIQF